ncbi:MAG TPA: CcoQ/FixQ family Cbb3-type cytochrome c oxidase assembly chaperone [Anaeromyxobacteraceae bacterium]|nr:CcoQ/FixQ family Cbb3-type cytochrome c oxidase assembly chaperone [Anaeromyxobacteraceae bacterium]
MPWAVEMPPGDAVYLVFGILLSAAMVWVIVHYYSRKRKKSIEEAKYKMLDDDD